MQRLEKIRLEIILDSFRKTAKLEYKAGKENETRNSAYPSQTRFMVVAGPSYGVACADVID
jgi:hypothetical protein